MNTIKEKAKAYDEAIKKAKEIIKDYEKRGLKEQLFYAKEDLEGIFPELKESEEERIKKELYKDIWTFIPKEKAHKYINWFEKQDEQKHADKVKPKFHEGDWVVYEENIYQIHNISLKKYYECLRTDGTVHTFDFEYIDSKSHIWNIADAKDGDILADEYGIYIFNSFDSLDDKLFICECAYEYSKKVLEIGGMLCSKTDFYPASKEQRDLLFAKMKEADYEWDAEHKQLKKIEHDAQLTEFEDAIKDMMNDYRDAIGDNDATIEEIKKHSAYLLSLLHPNSK